MQTVPIRAPDWVELQQERQTWKLKQNQGVALSQKRKWANGSRAQDLERSVQHYLESGANGNDKQLVLGMVKRAKAKQKQGAIEFWKHRQFAMVAFQHLKHVAPRVPTQHIGE